MCLTCLNVYTLKTFGWADILTLVCVVFTVSEGTAATVYSDPCLCKKQRVPYLLEEVIWTLILRPLIVGGLCGAWPGIQLRSRPLSTAFWPALICHPTECRSSGMAIGWGGGGANGGSCSPHPQTSPNWIVNFVANSLNFPVAWGGVGAHITRWFCCHTRMLTIQSPPPPTPGDATGNW